MLHWVKKDSRPAWGNMHVMPTTDPLVWILLLVMLRCVESNGRRPIWIRPLSLEDPPRPYRVAWEQTILLHLPSTLNWSIVSWPLPSHYSLGTT